MRIMIFSGTTEGRRLSHRLAELGAEVTVSVATDYGSEEQGEHPGIMTLSGRMPVEEMVRRLREMDLCVDATHPYAARVSASIRSACVQSGTPCRRLLREESELPGDAVVLENAAQAASYLAEQEGKILLTTGAKELGEWRGVAPERLYPRILPTHEGLSACEALGIPHRNVCAMQGPFSRELNEALLRQYGIGWLVTKDGGEPGGFSAKAEAARNMGVRLLVLRRPQETGESYEEVLNACIQALKGDG